MYSYAHIGNLRTYIFEDILKRVLLYNEYKVKHVMNITDVGHLTSDADTGEDKMLIGAKREGKTVWEIAEIYIKSFKNDMKRLNISEPEIWCKATDHIKEQIELIKRLEKKGFAYKAGGNVYFDTSKFKAYGKLAKLDLKTEKKARVEKDPNKKNPHDFVLWFTKSKFQDQEMKWDSPWGLGYPGWHLECSAMSMKYLGDTFDVHCGGIDHIPIHHTNEIAQSEAATGKQFVRYWLHGEFLVLEKEKMAKSGGNIITLQTIIDKGYDSLDYRYLCLTAHYRTQLTFDFEALDAAQNSLKRLKEIIYQLKQESKNKKQKLNKRYYTNFLDAINNDLDTPKILSILWNALRDKTLSSNEKLSLIEEIDKVLGLDLLKIKEEKIPKDIKELAEKREKARKDMNWKLADELRQGIKEKGYLIEDLETGYRLKSFK